MRQKLNLCGIKRALNNKANKNGAIRAFKVCRDPSRVRKSLHIYPEIWERFSKEIHAKIRVIKEELKPPDRREASKPKPIPP